MTPLPHEVAPGLWRWTARHPRWHPGAFGAEVASFALQADGDLLLVDPLVPADDDAAVLAALDGLAAGRAVLVTHGAPVLEDGAAALRAAVAAEPWYHHG